MKKNFKAFFFILITVFFVVAFFVGRNTIFKKDLYKKKQIILISIDALRADHLPSYGYKRNTSPAISGSQLFIRTATHLYCIGR